MNPDQPPLLHPLADVQSPHIGPRTRVWQFSVVLAGARIGADCNINAQVFIENDVSIGDRVTVKCGVQLWDGLSVEDDVFIGPNVTFTNDPTPRSRRYPASFQRTLIERGASIGANATILGGVRIGAGALIGAGSVVTRDVPAGELWVGNPARSRGPAPA
jgi:UDP-2-acetamido-3-amino-2,3-dideoxy-glucuronate N-acetyltransferase